MIDHLPLPRAGLHLGGGRVAPVTVGAAQAWAESYNRYVAHRLSVDEYNLEREDGGYLQLNPWPVAAISWPDDDVVAFHPYLESARRTKAEAKLAPRHPVALVLHVAGLGYRQHNRLIDLGAIKSGCWIDPQGEVGVVLQSFAEVLPPPPWRSTPEGKAAAERGESLASSEGTN